jgi:hypothetical protein
VAQEFDHPGTKEETKEKPAEEKDPPTGRKDGKPRGGQKDRKEPHLKKEVIPLEVHPDPPRDDKGKVKEIKQKKRERVKDPEEEEKGKQSARSAKEMKEPLPLKKPE